LIPAIEADGQRRIKMHRLYASRPRNVEADLLGILDPLGAAKPPPNRHQLYLEPFQMVAVAALTLD
jgi:hypothetical protein